MLQNVRSASKSQYLKLVSIELLILIAFKTQKIDLFRKKNLQQLVTTRVCILQTGKQATDEFRV